MPPTPTSTNGNGAAAPAAKPASNQNWNELDFGSPGGGDEDEAPEADETEETEVEEDETEEGSDETETPAGETKPTKDEPTEGEDETAPEQKAGEEEEDPDADGDARTQKHIKFKNPDGKYVKVSKDALFPYKKDGKIQWLPVGQMTRQFDGMVNYSERLRDLSAKENEIQTRAAALTEENEGFKQTFKARQEIAEKAKQIFASNAPIDQKLGVIDQYLLNEVGTSGELFMYDMMDNLAQHIEKWAGMSPAEKRALRAEAELTHRKYLDDVDAARKAEKSTEADREATVAEVQTQIKTLAGTYGFTLPEWEKAYQTLEQSRRAGERQQVSLQDVFHETMRGKIHQIARELGPKEINPIFKDPKKAQELAEAIFAEWRVNPDKPKEWFIKMAKAAFGADAAIKEVNEKVRKSAINGRPTTTKPKPTQKKDDGELGPNWRW